MEPSRRVYAVTGVPPEIQAYAMAKYSRSAQSMVESIGELSAQRAEQFLNTFYFQYGHRSIADLAHLHFAVENVSILAAVRLVDEPLWDGQERSTRYQPFRKTGYFVPPEIFGTETEGTYRLAADRLFDSYDELSRSLTDFLVQEIPAPDGADPKAHERTLRARAFDVARGLLPLATHTSVGQVVSARVLERQISRLLADRYPEVRALGADLRAACLRPAEDPLRRKLEAFAQELSPDEREALSRLVDPGSVAPTLVKYTQPDTYPARVHAAVAGLIAQHLPIGLADPWRTAGTSWPARLTSEPPTPDRPSGTGRVRLVSRQVTPLDELVATLAFRVAADGSYPEVLAAVQSTADDVKRRFLEVLLRERSAHDEHLREQRTGYRLAFDVLMDYGSFRDLHRHRRCVQVLQELTPGHGFDPAAVVFPLAFGEELGQKALAADFGDCYEAELERAGQSAGGLIDSDPDVGPYLLPLAFRQRSLFKMDDAEAAYIIELRSGAAGHFSYRSIAYQMWEALRDQVPDVAAITRVTNPHEVVDLLRR